MSGDEAMPAFAVTILVPEFEAPAFTPLRHPLCAQRAGGHRSRPVVLHGPGHR
jgi:hypothetical protein